MLPFTGSADPLACRGYSAVAISLDQGPDRRRRDLGLWGLGWGLGAMPGLFGCAPVAALITDPVVELQLQASAGLNPDVRLRPSPVLLRLYELKTSAGFMQADFISLYQRDQAELGGDMLYREEIQLQPGDRRNLRRPLNTQTRFVGLMAAYRDLERSRWRVVLPVEPSHRLVAVLNVGERDLTVVSRP